MATHPGEPAVVAGRPRQANRLLWGMDEFLGVPLLVVLGHAQLAALVITIDRMSPLGALRDAISTVAPSQTMSSMMQTITPGLLTAISIIFFVMVMAVQQQAGTYTTAMLDQFMQRRLNQVFFGLYVGLAVYFVAVLTLVPAQQMVLSSAVASVLAVTALTMLLLFIYNAFDQLRPSSSAALIEHIALRARGTQKSLLARTHRSPQLRGEPTTFVTTQRTGYVLGIDIEVLAAAIAEVHAPVEIEFRRVLGDHFVVGDTVAEVRGSDSECRERLAAAVLRALTIGRMRDIRNDAGYSVDQLAGMAWSASSAQQDPQGASVAIGALHSLMAIWGHDGEPEAEPYGGMLPVVYNDELPQQILDALTATVVATGQSSQHQTCADVIVVFADLLPRLSPALRNAMFDDIARVVSTATSHVLTVRMERALAMLRRALYETEFPHAAARIEDIESELARQVRELTAAGQS